MDAIHTSTTHSELVTSALRRFPDRIAFDHGGDAWTYARTADLVGRVVSVLHAAGLGPGEGIGMLSLNRPEVWVTQVAPAFLGGSYTALHPLGSLEDHLYACDGARLRFIFVDPAFAERASALLEGSASVERLFTFGPSDVGEDLLALVDDVTPTRLDQCVTQPDSTNWLLYTGGTTGVPKAVELSERAVAQMAVSVSLGWDLPQDRRYLAAPPISHAAGMMITATLLRGGTTFLLPGWDPEAWLAMVARQRITVGLLVPTMIYSLLDHDGLDRADLTSLETIMYGASPMAPARLIEGLDRRSLARAPRPWSAGAVGERRASGSIDVHTHFFPPALDDLAERTGDARWPSLRVADGEGCIMRGNEVFRVVAQPCWDVRRRLAAMDELGVDVHVMSPVPITLTTWAEPREAAEFARRQNDLLAEAAAESQDRLRWFGSVPLQDVDTAVHELERATTTLGMAGVEIGTEVGGLELDDPRFAPFFAAVQALRLPVFVHPTDSRGAIRRGGQPYEFGLGMLTDTAMAAAAIVFGGVLEAFPDLRIGFAHGCGTMPWAFPRLARGASLVPSVDASRAADLLRLVWVDSLVFDPHHLPLLAERFGLDHIVLGSDYPFYPSSWGHPFDIIDEAARLGLCDASAAHAIKGANGAAFLNGD